MTMAICASPNIGPAPLTHGLHNHSFSFSQTYMKAEGIFFKDLIHFHNMAVLAPP